MELLNKIMNSFNKGKGESTIYLGKNNEQEISELNGVLSKIQEYGIYCKLLNVTSEIIEIEFVGTDKTTEHITIRDKWNALDNVSFIVNNKILDKE